MKIVNVRNLVFAICGLFFLVLGVATHARAETRPPRNYQNYMPEPDKELGGTLPMIWKLNDREIQLRFSTDPASPSNIDQCPAWAYYNLKGSGHVSLSGAEYQVKSVCYLFALNSIWRYRMELGRDGRAGSAWIDCFSDFCWQ